MRQGNPGTQPHTHSTHPCLWLWPHGGGGSCHLMSFRPPSLAVVTTQSDPVCPGTSACAAQCLWDREALWPSAGGGPLSLSQTPGITGGRDSADCFPSTQACQPLACVAPRYLHYRPIFQKRKPRPLKPPLGRQRRQPSLISGRPTDLSAGSPGWKPPQGRYALGVSRRAARSSGEKESPAGTPNPPAPGR